MLTGFSKVKYGLQKPQPKGAAASHKAERKLAAPIAAFAAGQDDEEDVEAEIARQAAKKRSQIELDATQAAALAEDPSAFDYDGVYDKIKAEREQPLQQEKQQRKSRYIGRLLNKAVEREREANLVNERKLAKERKAEEHLFGDKEKFVTAAYKKKLAEDARWLEEEKRREEEEARNDVTKKGDLSDFYRNLLSKNVAFGGEKAAAGSSKRPVEEAVAVPSRGGKDGVAESPRARSTSREPQRATEEPPGARKETTKHEDVRTPSERVGDRGVQTGSASVKERVPEVSSSGRVTEGQSGTAPAAGATKGSPSVGGKPVQEADEAKQAPPPKRSAADAVAAAKERYLARKKQKES